MTPRSECASPRPPLFPVAVTKVMLDRENGLAAAGIECEYEITFDCFFTKIAASC